MWRRTMFMFELLSAVGAWNDHGEVLEEQIHNKNLV